MIHLEVYRITTDRWRRTWQAEWDGLGTNAVRAWTNHGVRRKANRQFRRHS